MSSCLRICCSSSVGTCSSFSACCSRGVMMSCVRRPSCREGLMSMAGRLSSHPELVAEIDLPGFAVVHQLVGGALQPDPPLVHDVRAVGDAQRLAHVVVGDQHAEPALAQALHDGLDLG